MIKMKSFQPNWRQDGKEPKTNERRNLDTFASIASTKRHEKNDTVFKTLPYENSKI
jgi:hypothetical protein